MRLVVITPERLALDTSIEEVYAPGVMGQFGVLPKHVNFLTALAPGEVRYRESGADRYMAVSGGVCEVLNDGVTILADAAEPAEDIDVERAATAERRALDCLKELPPGSPEYDEMRAAVGRATVRRQVATRAR